MMGDGCWIMGDGWWMVGRVAPSSSSPSVPSSIRKEKGRRRKEEGGS
jgi:hypothetical protein